MRRTADTTLRVALVSSRPLASRAWLSARSAATLGAEVHVLDLDASFPRPPLATEPSDATVHLIGPADLHLDDGELHRLALLLTPPALSRHLLATLLASLEGARLGLAPGVVLLTGPDALLGAATRTGLGLHSRGGATMLTADGRHPDTADLLRSGSHSPQVVALTGDADEALAVWRALTAPGAAATDDPDDARWLDALAATVRHEDARGPAALLSTWTVHGGLAVEPSPGGLLVDGRPVEAVDLSALDPGAPWALGPMTGDPRARLSDHPAFAAWVADQAGAARRAQADAPEPRWDLSVTGSGVPVHPLLRATVRRPGAIDKALTVPDPFAPATAAAFDTWLTEPDDSGIGRYLATLHATRPDLQAAWPAVPGSDLPGFLAWCARLGPGDHDVDPALLERAVTAARGIVRPAGAETAQARADHALLGRRPTHGVNVVGFLRGELGIGESARLMLAGLEAADVPHATVAVDEHSTSRGRAAYVERSGRTFDTSLICVNADLTGTVAAGAAELFAQTYRIGMWYWEVEDFPPAQHVGFDNVDEVWVATDFMHRAIAPHSPVPVRTVTPPLPQRGVPSTRTRADVGLPECPVFLFVFDFLSTAERKNPTGLIDAFTRAFTPEEGPVLVVKSINSELRPADAERLRLHAAAHPHVLLLEEYLEAADRDALVALCDCYVSLHRSEGLGLTMAEAMAWGKPVIATGYSGNLQFMTEENSYLVPWTPARIPVGADPYPAGGTWAEPDLVAAARLMRSVIEEPAVAAARGARAASDIATLHSPEVAGRQIVERLAESSDRRRARLRVSLGERLRSTARRLR